jgi:hypothetical protein
MESSFSATAQNIQCLAVACVNPGGMEDSAVSLLWTQASGTCQAQDGLLIKLNTAPASGRKTTIAVGGSLSDARNQ